jgi:hypothetical protein
MDHLTRIRGFDFVIISIFAMNDTVRGRRQKYGKPCREALNVPRITHASRAYCALPGSGTSAIGMRPRIVARLDLGAMYPTVAPIHSE